MRNGRANLESDHRARRGLVEVTKGCRLTGSRSWIADEIGRKGMTEQDSFERRATVSRPEQRPRQGCSIKGFQNGCKSKSQTEREDERR